MLNISPERASVLEIKDANEKLVSFPKIVLKKGDLQTPSYLYSLPPIGIGTPYVESLTSYILRLAQAHCVTSSSFFLHLIRILKGSNAGNEARKLSGGDFISNYNQFAHAINGINKMAADWVELLQNLTLQSNLKYLTMLAWQNILSNKGLQRYRRAWCPHCFVESRERGEIVYEQLLWTIKSVSFCTKHLVPLVTSCPYCDKQSYILTCKSRTGHCYQCEEPLGTKLDIENQRLDKQSPDIQDEIQNSNIITTLLNLSTKYPHKNERECLARNLHHCVNYMTSGNLQTFANALKMQRSILHGLCKQQHSLRIDLLTNICKKTDISVETLLFKKVTNNDLFKLSIPSRPTKEEIIRKLRVSLEDSTNPSLIEVAKELRYLNTDKLYKVDSELCRQISAKHRLANPQKRDFTMKQDLATIEHTLRLALKTTPPPSLKSVAEGLGYVAYSSISRRCPALANQLVKQRSKYLKNKKRKIEKLLKASLKETPPRSLSFIARKLGYASGTSLIKFFPELSSAVSKRFIEYKPKHQIILAALESALTEIPPPSVNSIAKSLKTERTKLYATNAELCRKISARHSTFTKKSFKVKPSI